MPKLAQTDLTGVSEIMAARSPLEGPTVPIFHAVQEEFGYVPEEAVSLVSSALNLSRAEVHGIVTFYHDFRRERAGRHVLKICRAEACQAMGSPQLSDELLRREGVEWGGTTPDGALTIEGVYCLGLCACAPAALYDGEPVARLDQSILEGVAREARRT